MQILFDCVGATFFRCVRSHIANMRVDVVVVQFQSGLRSPDFSWCLSIVIRVLFYLLHAWVVSNKRCICFSISACVYEECARVFEVV